ncbi:MAG: hypothetical protein MJE66_00160 [Proteobacteria bacterium]|nr:hypothetical protein [Pseudomonadota bacterium]
MTDPFGRKQGTKPRRADTGAWILGLVLLVASAGPAGAQLAEIRNIVNRVENKVDSVQTRTSQIRTTANDIASNVDDLPNLIQDRLGIALDPDMKDKVLEVFLEAREIIDRVQAQQADIAAFGNGSPGTACFDFRNDLQAVLTVQTTVANAVLETSGSAICPDLDVQLDGIALANLVGQIPCVALYPLSISFDALPLEFVAKILNRLEFEVSTDLLPDILDPRAECTEVTARQDEYLRAARTFRHSHLLLKIAAAAISKDNLTGSVDLSAVTGEIEDSQIGLHGYAELTLSKPKIRNKIAASVGGFSDLLKSIGDAGSKRVETCRQIVGQRNLMLEICTVTRFRSEACQALL